MVNDVTMIEAGPMPDYREIDLASEQGLALLRSAADRYGETIVQAAGIASRLFLLRSPWAPGLRFVGGQTKLEGSDDDGNPFETLSLSGTGETLEEALVSCIGEGIERRAQFERSGDVRARAALPELRDRVMPSLVPLIERQLANTPTGDAALEWIDGYMLEPGGEKHVGSPVLLPADWSLRRSPTRVRLRPPTMLGTGVAAGPDWDWAASRALLELVERDAAGLWWIGGRRGRPVALDDPSLPAIVRLLGTLRQDATRAAHLAARHQHRHRSSRHRRAVVLRQWTRACLRVGITHEPDGGGARCRAGALSDGASDPPGAGKNSPRGGSEPYRRGPAMPGEGDRARRQ